jgi:hypothetical protein
MLSVKDGSGTLRPLKTLKLMDTGGTVRFMKTLKVKDAGGTLRLVQTFAPPMTAAMDTGTVHGSGRTSAVRSGAATLTPTGGLAPYTYSWVVGTGSASIDHATMATTTFVESGLGTGEERFSTAACTVTDAALQTASASVSIDIIRTSGGGAL